jgi:phospholipid transport system substrate-binding protein
MRAMRFLALPCLMLLALSLLTLPDASADDTADATAFANDLGHKALAIITNNSESKEQKQPQLEALFVEYVDIDWVGKFVLGRFWRDASDTQKADYLKNYKSFLIAHYTSNLSEFTNVNFKVTRVTPADNGGVMVSVHIQRPNAEDAVVDYALRRENGQFRIYDIIVEGVSMITTQRSEFASVVSNKGLDYLIQQLAARSQTEAKSGS